MVRALLLTAAAVLMLGAARPPSVDYRLGAESVPGQPPVLNVEIRLRGDAETTFEYHLFNGIQGLVKDPRDGATVVNYFTEFGIAPAAEVDFDLDNATPASGALRKRCQAMIESVEDTLGGLAAGQIQLRAECGSAFFADLVAHKEVRETYLHTAAAADLRNRDGAVRNAQRPARG